MVLGNHDFNGDGLGSKLISFSLEIFDFLLSDHFFDLMFSDGLCLELVSHIKLKWLRNGDAILSSLASLSRLSSLGIVFV